MKCFIEKDKNSRRKRLLRYSCKEVDSVMININAFVLEEIVSDIKIKN